MPELPALESLSVGVLSNRTDVPEYTGPEQTEDNDLISAGYGAQTTTEMRIMAERFPGHF